MGTWTVPRVPVLEQGLLGVSGTGCSGGWWAVEEGREEAAAARGRGQELPRGPGLGGKRSVLGFGGWGGQLPSSVGARPGGWDQPHRPLSSHPWNSGTAHPRAQRATS